VRDTSLSKIWRLKEGKRKSLKCNDTWDEKAQQQDQGFLGPNRPDNRKVNVLSRGKHRGEERDVCMSLGARVHYS